MKYTQGYIPKIKYWYGVLIQAEGAAAMNKALSKMNYFQNRHYEVYGKWISVDDLIDTLSVEDILTLADKVEGSKP